jgi:hypothetical protein
MPNSPEGDSPDETFFNDLSRQPSDSNEHPDGSPQHNSRTNSLEGQKDDGANKVKRIACVLCRKRKLRCDGARPTCGTCKRLAHDCAYDEVRKKSGPKRGYVKLLEARLRMYRDSIRGLQVLTHSYRTSRDIAEEPGPCRPEQRCTSSGCSLRLCREHVAARTGRTSS